MHAQTRLKCWKVRWLFLHCHVAIFRSKDGRLQIDISDCMEVLQHFIKSGIVESKRVAVCGGSHGGFLAGHAIGQHSSYFKAAVMRNPVLDISLMSRVRTFARAAVVVFVRLHPNMLDFWLLLARSVWLAL
jgi:alpha-beta hydrolase superfamily lysophospholipase